MHRNTNTHTNTQHAHTRTQRRAHTHTHTHTQTHTQQPTHTKPSCIVKVAQQARTSTKAVASAGRSGGVATKFPDRDPSRRRDRSPPATRGNWWRCACCVAQHVVSALHANQRAAAAARGTLTRLRRSIATAFRTTPCSCGAHTHHAPVICTHTHTHTHTHTPDASTRCTSRRAAARMPRAYTHHMNVGDHDEREPHHKVGKAAQVGLERRKAADVSAAEANGRH